MERNEYLEKRREIRPVRRERPNEISGGAAVLGLIGGLALLGIAALVVVALPDIKRYYRISTM